MIMTMMPPLVLMLPVSRLQKPQLPMCPRQPRSHLRRRGGRPSPSHLMRMVLPLPQMDPVPRARVVLIPGRVMNPKVVVILVMIPSVSPAVRRKSGPFPSAMMSWVVIPSWLPRRMAVPPASTPMAAVAMTLLLLAEEGLELPEPGEEVQKGRVDHLGLPLPVLALSQVPTARLVVGMMTVPLLLFCPLQLKNSLAQELLLWTRFCTVILLITEEPYCLRVSWTKWKLRRIYFARSMPII
mmetsp:Transcript_18837/g.30368  ORF Transcript_18837/g.30368 Transcript_18837/m.30368 type:complete len:240 (+) Transcript_18837:673-1392(+)